MKNIYNISNNNYMSNLHLLFDYEIYGEKIVG